MKRFLKGFLCGMLTTSMMLVVALTVGQFSGYIDLGAAWNRTDQDSTMKLNKRLPRLRNILMRTIWMTSIKIRWKILYTKES